MDPPVICISGIPSKPRCIISGALQMVRGCEFTLTMTGRDVKTFLGQEKGYLHAFVTSFRVICRILAFH